MLVVDMHLDIAMNALLWNRDQKLSVAQTRELERDMPQKGRARGAVAFPDMRQGDVAIASATVIARVKKHGPAGGIDYRDHDIAYAMAQGQLAYYRQLQSSGQVRILTDVDALDEHVRGWVSPVEPSRPLGLLISMEGADPIVSPDQVPQWWNDGLRIVSLAHYGPSKYAMGTGVEGPLTADGPPLLAAMEQAGMILDVTHLSDESFWQATELFSGPMLASHSNCRSLVPGDRQLTDDMIKLLIQRGAVIGAVMDAWMLYPGWIKGETSPEVVSLDDVVNHIDRVCQLAGNSQHAAIGTDLDGGYGTEQTPGDLDTIADLQKLPDLLRKRGYQESDVEGIMHGNWLRLLHGAWGRG